MQTNSNLAKFEKQARFDYEESQERTTKGRKLNKTKHLDKRHIWENENSQE